MENEIWITPLLLLPGVGLLIASTTARYARIHEEFHHLEHHGEGEPAVIDTLFHRARLFRDALVSLYVSMALFAASALMGAVGLITGSSLALVVVGGSSLGVLGILFSSVQLIRESVASLHILQWHMTRAHRSTAPSGEGGP